MTVTIDSGAFCPVPPPALLEQRLRSGKYRLTEECGLEKRCGRCKDYWPADTEFYHSVPSHNDGLNTWCKACYGSWRRGEAEVLQALPDACATG